MERSTPAAVAIALACLAAVASSQGTCRGAVDPRFDAFCDENCNHFPSYCPPSYCVCDGVTPTPSPNTGLTCVSLAPQVGAEWCTMICNYDITACPPTFCSCSNSPPPDAVVADLLSYWQANSVDGSGDVTCCASGRPGFFYTEADGIYKRYLDSGSSELCSTVYGDPDDLVIDEDGVVWVVSRVSNTLWRVPFDCSGAVQVLSWQNDEVPIGGAITIMDGHIYIAGHTGVFELDIDTNKNVAQVTNTGWTNQEVGAMASYDGCTYFTVQNKDVYRFCPDTDTDPTLFVQADSYRFPDVAGVAVTSCGVFLSVTDSNQVWRCDLSEAPGVNMTCERLCAIEGIDADTCFNMVNPWDLSVGCCCDLYAVSRTSGTIVVYEGDEAGNQNGTVVVDGLNHPKGIAFFAQGPPCGTTLNCTA